MHPNSRTFLHYAFYSVAFVAAAMGIRAAIRRGYLGQRVRSYFERHSTLETLTVWVLADAAIVGLHELGTRWKRGMA